MLGKFSSFPLSRCSSGYRRTIEGCDRGAEVDVRTQGINSLGPSPEGHGEFAVVHLCPELQWLRHRV